MDGEKDFPAFDALYRINLRKQGDQDAPVYKPDNPDRFCQSDTACRSSCFFCTCVGKTNPAWQVKISCGKKIVIDQPVERVLSLTIMESPWFWKIWLRDCPFRIRGEMIESRCRISSSEREIPSLALKGGSCILPVQTEPCKTIFPACRIQVLAAVADVGRRGKAGAFLLLVVRADRNTFTAGPAIAVILHPVQRRLQSQPNRWAQLLKAFPRAPGFFRNPMSPDFF